MWNKVGAFSWSSGPNAGPAARLKSWTLDRNFDEREGERLLQARNYAGAEVCLAKAAVDAEMRKRSASKRIHLRLLLAEAQRRQYHRDPSADRPGDKPGETIGKKLSEAEAAVRSALEIAGKNSERDLYIQCLDALADIFADQGNFAAVEKIMLQAIKLESGRPHPDNVRMARRVLRLGVARHRLGRLDEALPELEKAVALHEKNYGEDHEETADHLTALGAAHRAKGNHQEAQKLLRRAMRIHERKGVDAQAALIDLHHLAGSLEESGDLEGAAAQYERALTYKHRLIGSNLEDLAELQFGLASLYITWQNFSRARELLYEATGTFRRHGGIRLAVSCETLAYVEECSGRFNEALKEFTLASKVWETTQPPRIREQISNTERRIELLEMLRRKGEAQHLREKLAALHQALAEQQMQQENLAEKTAEDEFELVELPERQMDESRPRVSLPLAQQSPSPA